MKCSPAKCVKFSINDSNSGILLNKHNDAWPNQCG
uniref:Uncharacterized protein n=1 Tax=Rhizophora mucronata TaxID=61149 RepID=A0A2P2P6N0_RHIMU